MQAAVQSQCFVFKLHLRAIFFFFFTSWLLTGLANAQDVGEKTKKSPVDLQLAAMVNKTGTTLACILTNTSERDVLTLPTGNAMSYLVMQTPQGEVRKLINPIDHLDVRTLKPAESFYWKIDMSWKIGQYQVVEPGLYQFHWEWQEFTPRHSDAGAFYHSNDILLLREPEA